DPESFLYGFSVHPDEGSLYSLRGSGGFRERRPAQRVPQERGGGAFLDAHADVFALPVVVPVEDDHLVRVRAAAELLVTAFAWTLDEHDVLRPDFGAIVFQRNAVLQLDNLTQPPLLGLVRHV